MARKPEGSMVLDSMHQTLNAIKTVRSGVATEGTSLTVDQCIALVDYFDANRRYLCGEEDVDRGAKALDVACGIIEVGDQRLLASDGLAGNQPPDISLVEWRRLYKLIDRARTTLRRQGARNG